MTLSELVFLVSTNSPPMKFFKTITIFPAQVSPVSGSSHSRYDRPAVVVETAAKVENEVQAALLQQTEGPPQPRHRHRGLH